MKVVTTEGESRHSTKGPMRVIGCRWEMWSGTIGITEDLYVTDGNYLVGVASDLPDEERAKLANAMCKLWKRFAKGELPEHARENLQT